MKINKLFAAMVVSTFGLSAISVLAADLTPQEKGELRPRPEVQADRLQNPDRRADDVKLNQPRGDVQLNARDGVKPKVTKARKTKKAKGWHAKKENAKRKVKKIPGALVRKN